MDEDELRSEIAELEGRLQAAKLRLGDLKPKEEKEEDALPHRSHSTAMTPADPYDSLPPSSHFLLLLADSALPIGSFAFSSGLESFVAHNHHQNQNQKHGGGSSRAASASPFSTFLPLSLSAYASTTLPFVLAAHRDPALLPALDDEYDATVICTVGRRASVAQGRALLGVWERSFRAAAPASASSSSSSSPASEVLDGFSALLKKESKSMTANAATTAGGSAGIPLVAAHLGPLFGVIAAAVGLTLRQTAYVFVLGHVKALVSAAVRANMFGPYRAQMLLASPEVQAMINEVVNREWDTPVGDAGQTVPVMDLWIGRHETLYSRIFNS